MSAAPTVRVGEGGGVASATEDASAQASTKSGVLMGLPLE
jgi:hypothetical protein